MHKLKIALLFSAALLAANAHAQYWALGGNTGTSSSAIQVSQSAYGYNFIGTTDNNSLVLGTNNAGRAILDVQTNMWGGSYMGAMPNGVSSCFTWGLANTFASPANNSASFGIGNIMGAASGFAAGDHNTLAPTATSGAVFGSNNTNSASTGFIAGVINSTSATAQGTISFGYFNRNYADYSFASGEQNTIYAPASNSVAFGTYNAISGFGSFALGRGNVAANNNSMAIGVGAGTNADNQFAANYAGGYTMMGGNMLIGKTTQLNASYKLDVAGWVRADKLVVNTGGADFVFDPSYELRPLSDLKSYLEKNRHLPGIAPAVEMQKEGVEVGESQAKLLQKVEELTLYIIQQDKEQGEQKKLIREQDRLLLEMKGELAEIKQAMDRAR